MVKAYQGHTVGPPSVVAAATASSRRASRFASKHYDQWTSKERIRASERGTQQCPSACPGLSRAARISPSELVFGHYAVLKSLQQPPK